MCGILGGLSRSPDLPNFREGLSLISHRGPDSIGYEQIGDALFGHTRLSIIDLSPASNQPLWDVERKACIVFNGEIYNYKIIRERLEKQGVVFNSCGDAEVILNLYLHGGENWIKELSGMFSFAIWDVDKQELFLARDPFGVKPLYYTESQDGFFFSSEIKALLKISKAAKDINFDAIFRTIVFLWSPGPETVLKNVYKLEPGHFLVVKKRKIVQRGRFWDWPTYSPGELTGGQAISEVSRVMEESVAEQLVSDVPLGAFLSGGLDSSLIVAMAKKAGIEHLQCFTIKATNAGDNDGFADDLPYAKSVSEFLEVDLNIVDASPDISRFLTKMLYHLDEPQADPAPLNVLLICELARKNGIKVLLSGAGGDDVFTGYRRHRAIKLEKFWSGFPKSARMALQRVARSLPKSNPVLRRLSKAFFYAGLEPNERVLSYFYWIDPDIVKGLFVEDIQESILESPMAELLSEIDRNGGSEPLEKMLHVERKYFLVDHNLNYTDKMSMASGVEVRVPFLDSRVATVASRIDNKFKQRGGVGKWVLKKAAEPFLPKSVIYRPKSGFGAPLRHWLHNDLKPMVDELLSSESLSRRGIFNPEAVRGLIDMDRCGREDYSYPIFSVLCIELWCRIFIDVDMEAPFSEANPSEPLHRPV